MAINELNLSVRSESSINTYRLLGIIGMVGAPALYLSSLFQPANYGEPNPNQIFASAFGLLYLCGAMANAIAMRRLRVTGNGIGGAILFTVQIIGLFLAMWCDILEYAAPHLKESTVFFITDMAYPFSHVLMIVVGVAVWKTGVWRGWRTIPAFLCGFSLPSFFAASAIIGRENVGPVFIIGVTLGFLLLGCAVKTTK